MPLFIIFVFGAVVLGAGAMFSPALPTRQPRIGLAAALALALVVGGAIFWQELFGADTLVIDYVLFALVSFVVLGGTLSQAQMRAEAKGEELLDADQGWTGPQDLAFFALVGAMILLMLRIVTPVASDGVFSPGYDLLTDYLSQQLNQPRPFIQQSMAAVLVFLGIWGIYDLGSELRDKRVGRTMALAWIPVGVFLIFTGGMFTSLMGLTFITAYLLFMMRVLRHATWQDTLGAGLMLGASLYASVPALLVALFMTLLLLILMRLNPLPNDDTSNTKVNPPAQRRRILSLVSVPLVALAGTLPWLLTHINNPARDIYWHGLDTGLWMTVALVTAIIGGFVLLWLWDSLVPAALRMTLYRRYYVLAAVCAVVIAALFVLPV